MRHLDPQLPYSEQNRTGYDCAPLTEYAGGDCKHETRGGKMAVWITKKLTFAEWGATQFRMHLLQQEMGQPLHLAMLLHPGEIGSADVSSLCQIIR